MTSGMVGSARIEITGDIATFARETETQVRSLMTRVGATIDESMAKTDVGMGRAGVKAGRAYGTGASTGIKAGSAGIGATVAGEAEVAGVEGGKEFGLAGEKVGRKFAQGARDTMKSMGGAIFAGIGVLGAGALVKGGIEAADQLEGANIKVQGSFGKSSAGVQAWAKTMASSLGLSQSAAENAAGTFGQMLHGMGVGQDQAAGMSEKMSELTQNVARFNNADPAAVQSAFVAALRGRGKALLALGINLDTTTISAEALRHGIVNMGVDTNKVAASQDTLNKAVAAQQKVDKDTSSTAADRKAATDKVTAAEDNLKAAMGGKLPVLTASQKGLASYYAILDGTKNQANAVADSDHTLAQQKKILGAEVQNLEAKFGTLLLPTLTRLAEYVSRDVIPAIADFGHWIAQNKDWIEPLAKVLAGLAAAYVGVRLAMGAYHKVMDAGKAIHQAYSTAAGIAKVAAQKLGLMQREQATSTATTTEEQNAATNTSNAEAGTSREAMATTMGEADATIVEGAEATSASVVAANDAIIASNREVALSRRGVGGAAGAGEGAVAGEAATAGEGAAIGGEAEAAGAGVAGAGEAAGASMAAAVAPLLAVGAAVVGIGLAINKLDGDDKKWSQLKTEMTDFGNIDKNAKTFADAINADHDALGATTEQMIITAAQSNGLGDSFGKAGISLADLTRGVTGTNASYSTMMTTWKNAVHPSNDLIVKLDAMRMSYLKGKDQALKLTQQQLALNSALNSLKPPPPIRLVAKDDVTSKLGTIRRNLQDFVNGHWQTLLTINESINSPSGGFAPRGAVNVAARAGGGVMAWNEDGVLGEDGPERYRKRGAHIEIIPNDGKPAALSGAAFSGTSTTGGMHPDQFAALIEAIENRPVYAYVSIDKQTAASKINEGNMMNARR